ncbi:hypothetical protein [Butyrivibrio sp. MC2013]|uniref:hypothetical protein n=1 Tax=Butyrivibrio sp. MC2013 TaxID=1280686 RepID=UPI000423D8D1|nr:hypothetical protein [Butyrivibrio sp. MC2013]
MNHKYMYKIYGLKVASDIEIPPAEVLDAEDEGTVDVEIVLGDIPSKLEDAVSKGYNSWINGFGEAWFNTPGTGQYYVHDGRRIVVKPVPNGDDKLLYSMLLSAGLCLIILQRNEMVLHGGVIVRDGHAFVVSGESGAGKSTITMELLAEDDNYFLADDTVRILTRDEGVYAQPTYPQQKVCRDVAEKLGIEGMIYIDEERDKFAVPRREKYISEEMLVNAIYILRVRDDIDKVQYQRLTGKDYIDAVVNNLYLSVNYKRDLGVPMSMIQMIGKMYDKVAIYYIDRPTEGDTVEEIIKQIKLLQLC